MPVNSFESYPMSWRPKISKNGSPLYLTIADALERDIKSGLLLPNDKLPPQRELADFLDVNLSTITRAFKICETKGLISGKTGSGTFVSSDVNANLPMLYDSSENELINLGASHPLYIHNKYVVQLIKKLPSKINVENLLRYYNISGTYSQKESAHIYLKNLGISTNIENILITSGLQNSLAIILASLFEAKDKIITNSVVYPGFKNIASMLGIILVPIPYLDKKLDLKYLDQICKSESIKGIYLMADFQNPTTITMDEEERFCLNEYIKKYNLIGIEDGTYSFLNKEPNKSFYEINPNQMIHISTLSNSISAGLRIAFLVSPYEYRDKLLAGIRNINVMSSPVESEIISQLIQSGMAKKIVDEKRKEIEKRNKICDEILGEYELWGNNRCQFRWLLLPSNLDSQQVEQQLYQRKIEVFSSKRFLVGNATYQSALRLAITSPQTIKQLKNGLNIIKSVLEKSILRK